MLLKVAGLAVRLASAFIKASISFVPSPYIALRPFLAPAIPDFGKSNLVPPPASSAPVIADITPSFTKPSTASLAPPATNKLSNEPFNLA